MGACGVSHVARSDKEREKNVAALDAFFANIDIYANGLSLVRRKIELFQQVTGHKHKL